MFKTIKNKIAFTALVLLSLMSFSQEKVQIDTIIEKYKEVCHTIQSIKYEVLHTYKNGGPIIKATIINQKADVQDVGFGKTMIKVTGTIKERGALKPFFYAYDGEFFFFEIGGSGIKKYENVTSKLVSGLLKQHLMMLHVRLFSKSDRLKRGENSYLGKEEIDGKVTYKIKNSIYMYRGDKEMESRAYSWIDSSSYLPIASSNGFGYKRVTVKEVNRIMNKEFFFMKNKGKSIAKRSYQETQDDLNGKDVLKVGTTTPKWSAISQDGKKFSSELLKGKVVLIDFWGTWCPPCIKAMPDIEKLQQIYKDHKDIAIIGISALEKKPNAAENYFKSKGYTYIHIPKGEKIAELFKVKAFPTLYVINKQGKIVQATIDYDKHDYEMSKKLIDKHLK